MNQAAEDAITAMLNCFPQTSQNYEVLLATLDRLCAGMTDRAIIDAAERFAAGNVPDQSKKFAPSGPEFMDEVRRQEDFISIRNKPRISSPPVYRGGPLPPFMMARQKLLNAHLPVLFEDVNFDQWKRLSKEKMVPTGAKWVAALGTVYGPEPKHQIELAVE